MITFKTKYNDMELEGDLYSIAYSIGKTELSSINIKIVKKLNQLIIDDVFNDENIIELTPQINIVKKIDNKVTVKKILLYFVFTPEVIIREQQEIPTGFKLINEYYKTLDDEYESCTQDTYASEKTIFSFDLPLGHSFKHVEYYPAVKNKVQGFLVWSREYSLEKNSIISTDVEFVDLRDAVLNMTEHGYFDKFFKDTQ